VADLGKTKRFGVYYTPDGLAAFLATKVAAHADLDSDRDIRVLDPACGDGALLAAFVEATPASLHSRLVLVGVDRDAESLAQARAHLTEDDALRIELIEGDFLDLVGDTKAAGLFARPSAIAPAHVIVANPPYVRTQALGADRAQELAAAFDLSGRVDLYQAFLVAMSRTLVEGGTLGAILSNRFLSTKSGASTRKHFDSAYEVLDVTDLGDTKLFEAAVLPAVIVARKYSKCHEVVEPPRFARIYEREGDGLPNPSPRMVESIQEALSIKGTVCMNNRIFDVVTGVVLAPVNLDDPWQLVSDEERDWMNAVEEGATTTVGDLVKARVGIKTTADKVFIRDDWDHLPPDRRPEPDVILPLITSDDARAPERGWPGPKCVLYTHEVADGRRRVINMDLYPKAAAYLQSHYERLAGRTYVRKAKRAWYEIWVPQDPDAWGRPKLVWPDISEKPRFSLDESGSVVNGDCYWIGLPEHDDLSLLLLIQGVANSELMTTYHDLAFRNQLYSGRRRYLTQYVSRYPLPDPQSPRARDIIEAVRALNAGGASETAQDDLREEVDRAVYRAFSVAPFRESLVPARLAEEV
jgi:SAM-dependent methyltransferase